MIPTPRRLQYARGYIDLGMVNEASDELVAVDWDDRMKPEVLAVRVDLYLAAKNWESMEAVSRGLATDQPDIPQGWVHWAYAFAGDGQGD